VNEFVIQIGFPPEVVAALLEDDIARRTATLIKCHLVFDKAVDNALDEYRKEA
jgi:hypothetical protein